MQTGRSTVCFSAVTNAVQKLVKSFIFSFPECKHSGSSSLIQAKNSLPSRLIEVKICLCLLRTHSQAHFFLSANSKRAGQLKVVKYSNSL